MKLWNYKGEQNSITEALQLKLPEHAVISVTGAGGKTSLIFAWARELAATGKSVVITTTTHMYRPERMEEEGIRIVVSDDPKRPDKVTAPPEEVLEGLRETADVVLVDGRIWTGSGDELIWKEAADTSLAVCRQDKADFYAIDKMMTDLQKNNTCFLGCILYGF